MSQGPTGMLPRAASMKSPQGWSGGRSPRLMPCLPHDQPEVCALYAFDASAIIIINIYWNSLIS